MKAEYSSVINWLLTAQEPWVVYNTLLELIGAEPDSTEVKAAYKAMQTHPSVVALLESLTTWPPEKPLSRAYDPKDSIWKLNTLADFGMRRDDERISGIPSGLKRARYVWPLAIRVTHIYRREEGSWKLIHRLGDAITEKIEVTAVLQK